MKRIDIFKEFLIAIFGSTTVKNSGGKIYRSGDWFSTCDFGDKAFDNYRSLLEIAYSYKHPQIQRPNYDPEDFNRTDSIKHFFVYLKSYKDSLTLPDITDTDANTFAYQAAITLLVAIFTKSDSTGKFSVGNEDISSEFRNALDNIKGMSIGSNINDLFNALNQSDYYIYDTGNKKTQIKRISVCL